MKFTLADKFPDLLKEWNYKLNKGLDPKKIRPSSNKKVSWICQENPEHIWQTSIAHRTAGTKCPYCSNQKILPSNSLEATNPDLAKEWHPSLNGTLKPSQVAGGSCKKVWWFCPTHSDHIYQAKISSRNRGAICSVCAGRVVVYSNSLKKIFPNIANEWHPQLNKKPPTEYTTGSNAIAHWQCSTNPKHVWKAKISSRTLNNRGCPYCRGKKADELTNFGFLFPDLLKEWDYDKNKVSPDTLLSNSAKKIWWVCTKNPKHKWQAILYSRTRNNYGCPYCTGRKADEETNITITHPQLLKEWNYEKNKKSPIEYKSGSNQKVWWRCDKGKDHIWLSSINNRKNGKNCPVCSGQKVADSTRLTTTHPAIAQQWHFEKNGKLKPENYHGGSSKSVWWRCDKGKDHEWKTEIRVRTLGSNCPICINKKIVQSNCLQTTHPKLANEFHPDKNGNITPNNVGSGSNKKTWWICKHNSTHEWKTVITARAIYKTGCPYCDLTPQSKEELIILFELKSIFKGIPTTPFKKKYGSKVYSFDIYIPTLNQVIEYDGRHWHKDNQAVDEKKIKIALLNDLNIFRVRQRPLKKITNKDIVVPAIFNGKKYVDLILQNILQLHSENLTRRHKEKIIGYLASSTTKCDRKLENYIDNLLKQKSVKNGQKKNAL